MSLFADVSEFQCPVDDSYPYRIFSFRSGDGAHRDRQFAANYAWAAKAADAGALACFIVYFYWRPDWADAVNTHKAMVEAAGGPHPRMVSMMDVESGGNPDVDESAALDATFSALAQWLGDPARVIGYANRGDAATMWPDRPPGMRIIGAGYGANPDLAGQIAHQYTDGQGDYGQGLPYSCPPFGDCDMNSADGLSPEQFAAACGITTGGLMALTDAQQADMHQKICDIWDQLRGPNGQGWTQLGKNAAGAGLTPVDAEAVIVADVEAIKADVEKGGASA